MARALAAFGARALIVGGVVAAGLGLLPHDGEPTLQGRTAAEWRWATGAAAPARRDSAVWALELLAPGDSVAAVAVGALLGDSVAHVRHSAARYLITAGNASPAAAAAARAAAVARLASPAAHGRLEALRVLGGMGSASRPASAAILSVMHAPAPELRSAATAALGQGWREDRRAVDDPALLADVVRALARAATDSVAEVRDAAVEAVTAAAPFAAHHAAFTAIVRRALTDDDPAVRERAVDALAHWPGERAEADALRRARLGDPHPAVRRAARRGATTAPTRPPHLARRAALPRP